MRGKRFFSKVLVRALFVVALACPVVFGPGIPSAWADERTGSLSLACVARDGESEIALAGDEYAVVRVASAEVAAAGVSSYETLAEFADFDCDWASLSSTELSRKADVMQSFAYAAGLLDERSVSDSQGRAMFSDLDPGLYLVCRTKIDKANADYAMAPFLVSVPVTVGVTTDWDVLARPKFEHGVVRVEPCNMTAYMGGSEGYGSVEGAGFGGTLFPIPMYTVEAPDGVDPESLVFEDVESGGMWKPVRIGHDEEGNACYRIDRFNDAASDARIMYSTPAGDSVTDDTFTPFVEQDLFKLFGIESVKSDDRIVIAHSDERSYAVSVGSAVLTVRLVEDDSILGNASTPVTDLLFGISPSGRIPSGVGVAAARLGTEFTLNETDVRVEDIRDPEGASYPARVGLLFDSIASEVNDRESALRTEVDKALPSVAEGSTRRYQSRYLDLVDTNDGNAWVIASDSVDVYWGYPEGTDEGTEFSLWHFPTLHRDGTDDPSQSGYDLEDIEQAPLERVEVENTPQGIKFTVPSGGFSPFVLVWEDDGSAVDGGSSFDGSWSSLLPRTGDRGIAALLAALLALALAVALTARRGRRRSTRR